MDLVAVAALAYAGATVVVVAFQIALALGAPWGRYAMGGRYDGRLPAAMRLAAVVQAIVLAVLALIVLSAAGVISGTPLAEYPWLVWIPVGVSALSVGLNAISRSAVERRTWVPVGLVLLASSLVVAVGG